MWQRRQTHNQLMIMGSGEHQPRCSYRKISDLSRQIGDCYHGGIYAKL